MLSRIVNFRYCALFLFWTSLLIACGGGGGGDGVSSEGDSSEPIDLTDYEGPPSFDLVYDEGTFVSETIYSDTGGQIKTDGAIGITLDIPSEALSEDTTISLSLYHSSNPDNYALVCLFEPDGLVLNQPGTLLMSFDPPLLPRQDVYIIEGESNDINASYDTGIVVNASNDGSTVELPITHFSTKGTGTEFVCHTHTNIRIIEWLEKKKNFTPSEIADDVDRAYGTEIKAELGKDPNCPQKYKADAKVFIQESIDSLKNNKRMMKEKSRLLLKGLLTEYFKKESAEPNVTNNVVHPTTKDCRDKIVEITEKGDVVIGVFGKDFGNDPLSAKFPHSAPTAINKDEKNSGRAVPVFENGASVNDRVGNAWKAALEERKKQYPNQDEIPKVLPKPIEDVDMLRDAVPVNSTNQYLMDDLGITENDKLLNNGSKSKNKNKPWGSARFYVPRDDLISKSLIHLLSDEICPYENPLFSDDIDHDGDSYSNNQGDCNDLLDTIHPGAIEVCDDLTDNDCDGDIDCNDTDCDGHIACSVVIEYAVWIHEESRTCCPGDFGGVAPYQYYGTEKGTADEGAIILATFDSQEDMTDWTCDRDVHIAYNWIRNWADIGGYIVTNLPCEANAPWQP